MIRNNFRGRCHCGVVVMPDRGFVHNRRFYCAACALEAEIQTAERIADLEPDYGAGALDDLDLGGRYGFDE